MGEVFYFRPSSNVVWGGFTARTYPQTLQVNGPVQSGGRVTALVSISTQNLTGTCITQQVSGVGQPNVITSTILHYALQQNTQGTQANLGQTAASLQQTQTGTAQMNTGTQTGRQQIDQTFAGIQAAQTAIVQSQTLLTQALGPLQTAIQQTQTLLGQNAAILQSTQTGVSQVGAQVSGTVSGTTTTQQTLQAAQGTLQSTQQLLGQNATILQQTQTVVGQTQTVVGQTQTGTQATQAFLLQNATAIQQTQTGVAQNQTVNTQTQNAKDLALSQLVTLKTTLDATQTTLQSTQTTIAQTQATLGTTQTTLGQTQTTLQTLQGDRATFVTAAQTTLGNAQTAQTNAGTAQTNAGSAQTAVVQAQAAAGQAQTKASQALPASQDANFFLGQHLISAQSALGNAQDAQVRVSIVNAAVGTKFPTGGGTMTGALSIQGSMSASQDITSYSDDRLKKRQQDIQTALEKVNSLHGFVYKFNELGTKMGLSDEPQLGLSAQEVQNVLPEIVKPGPFKLGPEDSNTYSTVAYGRMIPVLIEALKELNERIETVSKRIDQSPSQA